MPSCTEAEKALMDNILSVESSDDRNELEVAVLKERITPELKERAVRAHVEAKVGWYKRDAVWQELGKLGFVGGQRVGKLWDEFEAEADRRIAERGP